MDVVGYEEVLIADIQKPDNWKYILASEEAEARGRSIEQVGNIHEPMVRKSDMQLVAGCRRLAGMVRVGWTTCTVKLIECDDARLQELRDIENIERRHDPEWQAEIRKRLIDRYEREEAERVAAQKASGQWKRKRGREPSPRRLAQRKAAKDLGVDPRSLERQEMRDRQRKRRHKELGKVAHTEPEPPKDFHSLGMEVDRAFLGQVGMVQQYIRTAHSRLAIAQRELTKLANSEMPFPPSRIERMKTQIRETSHMVGGMMPVSLCPYCKGLEGAQDHCAGCFTTGFITKNQNEHIPEELLDEEHPKVMVQGTLYGVEEWLVQYHGYEDHLHQQSEPDEPEGDPWPL